MELGIGAMEKNLERFFGTCLRSWWMKRVKNPPEGFGPKWFVQLALTWGASNRRRAEPTFDQSRGLSENPRAVKSLTMRGPRGLVSNLDWGRCRTANASRRWVSGCF